jgi:hypothetical protein
VLWPSWEPDRVRADLRKALAAHAAYASAVLDLHPAIDADRARRAAGLASNNLEASLARVMQEPRRGQRDRLQAALVADGTLRRIAGRLTAISLDPPAGAALREAGWVVATLNALAEGDDHPTAPCPATNDTLGRLARQTALLAEVMRRVDGDGAR